MLDLFCKRFQLREVIDEECGCVYRRTDKAPSNKLVFKEEGELAEKAGFDVWCIEKSRSGKNYILRIYPAGNADFEQEGDYIRTLKPDYKDSEITARNYLKQLNKPALFYVYDDMEELGFVKWIPMTRDGQELREAFNKWYESL